ncbi:hypothetical protein BASA61_005559 [Batrachochytrium salamandrivorans]|nr:hypothetical protein BASA61_005559 [Batrachochytrium salamandrivorans]
MYQLVRSKFNASSRVSACYRLARVRTVPAIAITSTTSSAAATLMSIGCQSHYKRQFTAPATRGSLRFAPLYLQQHHREFHCYSLPLQQRRSVKINRVTMVRGSHLGLRDADDASEGVSNNDAGVSGAGSSGSDSPGDSDDGNSFKKPPPKAPSNEVDASESDPLDHKKNDMMMIPMPKPAAVAQGLSNPHAESTAIEKITVPDIYPQLLAIPLTRRPLFPGFYKSLYIKEPSVIKAIQSLVERRQPYIGIFLAKDESSDSDITGPDSSALTVVVYPHRRIRISDLVKPPPKVEHTTPEIENVTSLESTPTESVFHPINAHLMQYNVPLVNVDNLVEEPHSQDNRLIKAITSEIINVMKEISQLNPLLRDQIISISVQTGNLLLDPSRLADFAAAVSSGEPNELQSILESLVVEERLHKSLVVLKKELANAKLQQEISKEVDKKMTRKQQEYFLMEQLKGIKKELGIESDGKEKLVEKFKAKALDLTMPDAIKKVFDEEINKLQHLEPAASEFNVTRNYLDWLTQIPWGRSSKENYDIKHAVAVLDEDHYGLKDVKERILEFIAVGKLRGTVEGKIITMVGPPGVGKTSVGKSIARALGREFYRFSVGGLADVAEIKGHRRTYVGAMPGKVVQALKKVQTENPLIMIDEIDKLGRGNQGDPASALLELLDPEQNSSFLDHYLDVPLDLSKVLFVCTANTLDTIPAPLLDRMEIITLSGYVAEEKIAIASKYLEPASRISCGLTEKDVTISEAAFDTLIKQYCRESGVRNLKKQIDKIFRKAALRIVNGESTTEAVVALPETTTSLVSSVAPSDQSSTVATTSDSKTGLDDLITASEPAVRMIGTAKEDDTPKENAQPAHSQRGSLIITEENLHEFVGSPIFTSDRMYDETPSGVIMGLAWTQMGGSSLFIESVLESPLTEDSKPSFHRTGQMGDVMKESTTIAYTYARAVFAKRFPDNTFFQRASIHMHVPEGATPKDGKGPSAGSTMTTSLLSLALGKPAIADVAMTGEITLTGKILKIGGVKEKTIAAKRSGVKRIIFPFSNRSDWDELPDYIKTGLEPHFVKWYDEIFSIVFPDV